MKKYWLSVGIILLLASSAKAQTFSGGLPFSVTVNNPSVGSNGAASPTSSNQVGYKDGSGNLQPLSAGQKTMANSIPVVLSSDQSALPSSQSGTWNINNISGTVSLPTGAATSANQTTANTSLSSIDGKMNSLGQKTMANSMPVTLASDQGGIQIKMSVNSTPSVSSGTATTTPATVTAPANTVEVLIQALDSNSANLRVSFGAVCSSSSGLQLQPGRSEVLHVNANASICSESGSQGYVFQWVAQ